jgi:D-serine dehydratase
MNKTVCGKTIAEWTEEIPVISSAVKKEEAIWLNDKKESFAEAISKSELTEGAVKDASERLKRFASYFERAFPETKGTKGIIESPVKLIPKMKDAMEQKYGEQINGELLIKLDSHLPISGSIKARGGIYEVL